jgi:hypothetical protein
MQRFTRTDEVIAYGGMDIEIMAVMRKMLAVAAHLLRHESAASWGCFRGIWCVCGHGSVSAKDMEELDKFYGFNGTLICDLELGMPIDLLPDRSVETVSAWLLKHPSIKVVSRDGSSEYASAIQKGAPQARQVSDRWHLVKNLATCVSVQLTQSLTQLRRAGVTRLQGQNLR